MNAWLMDAYRANDRIILWVKTPEKEIRLERAFSVSICMDASKEGENFLHRYDVPFTHVAKRTWQGSWKSVYEISINNISSLERIVRWIERKTIHRIPLYDADILPEQLYLWKHDLMPCGAVALEEDCMRALPDSERIPLVTGDLTIVPAADISSDKNAAVRSITLNKRQFKGDEQQLLLEFAQAFSMLDPDVLLIEYAYSMLPYLVRRLNVHGISCPFHRWDQVPIVYRGGRSFFTYGNVRYRDFAIKLHGRFLVDTSTMTGGECVVDGIVELSQLSGACFQNVASRSFGSVFQTALVRELVRDGCLVPYKEKPIHQPLSLYDLLKSDRAGHTFDPLVGFHTDVAEIDFSSLYPWIMYNHNISADTLWDEREPCEHVPGIPVRISLRKKGMVPRAIKPFIDRRMECKKNPTALNKAKSVGLKWVLVSSNGYLRFREFKLGISTSHMAVCSFAREILLAAARLAEERGFEIVHGIIDSLYIKKKGICEKEVRLLCRDIEMICGIPVSFEGIFRWMVFLPSVLDTKRPVPTKYYGLFKSGDIKVRGIELRQRSAPLVVKWFQQQVLEMMSDCSCEEAIVGLFPKMCALLRSTVDSLPLCGADWLASKITIARDEYVTNIPQKRIVDRLRKKGVFPKPGQSIRFVWSKLLSGHRGFVGGNVVLPEEYDGFPDVAQYRKLLVRALFVVMQPFGIEKEVIEGYAGRERQSVLREYGGECSVMTRISQIVQRDR